MRALIILFALTVAPCIASELDAGYPTPSEVAAEQLEDFHEDTEDLEDFTDSGVGCTDDCLEPAEEAE